MQNENSIEIKSSIKQLNLQKALMVITLVFFPLIAFFVGVGYQRNKDSRTFNTLMKAANKEKEAVYVNQNNTPVAELREGKLESHVSKNLGVSFDYFLDNEVKNPIKVKELADKVYLYINSSKTEPDDPTKGKYVQVLSKNPSTDLATTVEEAFLKNYAQGDCKVVTEGLSRHYSVFNPDYDYVQIKVANVNSADSFAQAEEKANRCPIEYLDYRGVSYFVMDRNHTDKYAFVKLGQDNFSSYPGVTWDMTISFND